MSIQETVATERFRRESIAKNRHIKFAGENFKSADVIGVFMREKHPIKLFRRDAAFCQAQNQLSRTQPAIDKNLAMIGRDQRAVSPAAAAEHGKLNTGLKLTALLQLTQMETNESAPAESAAKKA